MKVHTQNFKDELKKLGKEIDNIITYKNSNNQTVTLFDELYEVSFHYNGNILKSIMKQLDIQSKVDIPINTELNYKLGVKISGNYQYLDYGNFIVTKTEKQEDTNLYKITCYDKMIYAMRTNENLGISYPISLKNYLFQIGNGIGLQVKDTNFQNQDRMIQEELYAGLDYTYRDILDEIAQATGSIIVINSEDKIEVKYPTQTNDTINEEYMKDINVKFGEKYGAINTVVLSRSAGSDNIYYPSPVPANPIEYKISDNQIMNGNDRSDYLEGIYNAINGLYYYVNDFSSIGILYYEVGDIYNVQIGQQTYQCLMLNDEINITSGIEETIYTKMPEETKTDYTKADKTDRKLNQAYIMVNKQQQTIEQLIRQVDEVEGETNEKYAQILTDVNGIINNIQNSGGNNLIRNSVMFAYDNDGIPTDWELSGSGTLEINSSPESINAGGISGHVFALNNKTVRQKILVKPDSNDIPEEQKTYYTFSTRIKKNVTGTAYVKIYNDNEEYYVLNLSSGTSAFYEEYELKDLLPTTNYYYIEFYGSADSDATFTDNMFSVGRYRTPWTQANGETMNTQVNINVDGVLVKSSVYEGDYTVMSPLEFAGYSNVNGQITRIFSLNKDTTKVEKLEANKEILMPPIKIVPITSGSMQGWAFVPST